MEASATYKDFCEDRCAKVGLDSSYGQLYRSDDFKIVSEIDFCLYVFLASEKEVSLYAPGRTIKFEENSTCAAPVVIIQAKVVVIFSAVVFAGMKISIAADKVYLHKATLKTEEGGSIEIRAKRIVYDQLPEGVTLIAQEQSQRADSYPLPWHMHFKRRVSK